jgi:hypothetical protein
MTVHNDPLISPEKFWHLYSKRLNEAGQQDNLIYGAYQGIGVWTPVIIKIAEQVLSQDFPLRTQREYLRVDLIGDKQDPGENNNNKWSIKVAYEHENDDNWDKELCKLCHVVADLRVIASYYDFTNSKKIEVLLQERINKLGADYITRVPNSSWLFIIGPRCRGEWQKEPFMAFTLDTDLKIKDISNEGEKVIPDRWEKNR